MKVKEMDSNIGNISCNDYRIGSNTVRALYKGNTLIWEKTAPTPTATGVTELWLPLSSITNYQAFNAIAWGTGYTIEDDRWVSEQPYVVSDNNYYWSDGRADYGWFATHRWNYVQYSLTFNHIDYGWDCPDVAYGKSVKDRRRSTGLTQTQISVCGNTEDVYMTEFHDWDYWKPCYGAFTDYATKYEGKVYGRVQTPNQLWYTTTDGEIAIGQRGMGSIEQYGDNGGIIEYTTGSPMSYISTFRNHNGQTNINTLIMPIGTVSSDIKRAIFDYCTGLTTVVCPPTVTDFPSEVFYGCSSLNKVFLGCSVFPQHGLEYNVDVPVNGTFYVPTGCDMTNFPQTGRFANWDVVYQ